MSQKDREKWNRKYKEMQDLLAPRPPSTLVKRFYHEAGGKRALDLACGTGRNTLFLAQKGFHVDAVDISEVALAVLKERIIDEDIDIIEADLEHFIPQQAYYDMIIKTNYLDRELIERAKRGLLSGGIFIVETYVEDDENEKRDSNPDFLLKKGELPQIFSEGFDILSYETFWNEGYEKYRMKKAAIAAQKR
jgi:SAM-dependent methyltransferase